MPRKPHPADIHNAQIVERATAWSAFTQAGGRIVRRFETRSEAREAAQLLADHFRRPALVYAIDPIGRSAVAETVQPSNARRNMESNMTTKTYSKRFNAQRAARSELGAEAQEGVHFRTAKTLGGWIWLPVRTGNPTPEPVAAETTPSEEGDREFQKRVAAKREAKRQRGKKLAEARAASRPEPSVSIGDLRADTHPIAAANAASWPSGRKPGKRAAIEEAARQGQLPTPPDFSKPTHARFRTKLAKLVELAEAGDILSLKAIVINPVSTSPKAMARYRDLAVIAIEARKEHA